MDSAPQRPPPAYTPAGTPQKPPTNLVRRYKRTAFVALVFTALLIVPWAFLCILNTRSVGYGGKSWTLVNGTIDEQAVENAENFYRACLAFDTFTAVLTVPVLGLLLSHAAVVLIQRRHPGQRLNAHQLLSLIDAPWFRLSTRHADTTGFIYLAYALLFLAGAQFIVRSSVVRPAQIQVATYLDVADADIPYGERKERRYHAVGSNPGPAALREVPLNGLVRSVASRMAEPSISMVQRNLWLDLASEEGPSFYSRSSLEGRLDRLLGTAGFSSNIYPFFAAPFPAEQDTGVLRYHGTRLNSTTHCDQIAVDAFPADCPGRRPFANDTTFRENGLDQFRIRWCIPGAYDESPWSTSRHRQDFTEELFLDVSIANNHSNTWAYSDVGANYTIHCTTSTTLGAFELPSIANGHQTGPLLQEWPSVEELQDNFNDEGIGSDPLGPVDENPYNFDPSDYDVTSPYGASPEEPPGPLTVSLIAMLGNGSWFQQLQNETIFTDAEAANTAYIAACSQGLPMSNWPYSYSYTGSTFSVRSACSAMDYEIAQGRAAENLLDMTFSWFQAFNDTAAMNQTLSAAVFLANDAALSIAASGMTGTYSGYDVSYAPGRTLSKPDISTAGIIVGSVLLGLEVLAIIALLVFIYRGPTFTHRVDAFATAVIGAQLLATGLPLTQLGVADQSLRKELTDHSGLIGVSGYSAPAEAGLDSGASRERGTEAAAAASGDVSPLTPDLEMRDFNEMDNTHSFAPSGSLVVGGMGTVARRAKETKRQTHGQASR